MRDLPQRVASVRLLLETLDDPYPTPRGSLRSDSGPAASRYVPCVDCKRQGWLKRRGGVLALCLSCDGRGWRRRKGAEEAWDTYTGLPVVEAAALPVEPVVRSAASSARLARDREEERSGSYRQLAHGWERTKALYERHGSYAELRTKLSRLHDEQPRRAVLVVSIHVEHNPRELTPRDSANLVLGVTQLALWMPRIKVPRFLVEETQRDANDAVTTLSQSGMSPGQIAAHLGMDRDRVKRTLRRRRQRVVELGVG